MRVYRADYKKECGDGSKAGMSNWRPQILFFTWQKLDKIHKFTGHIDFLLDKLVFFTGRKIPDNYDIFTGQKD